MEFDGWNFTENLICQQSQWLVINHEQVLSDRGLAGS